MKYGLDSCRMNLKDIERAYANVNRLFEVSQKMQQTSRES